MRHRHVIEGHAFRLRPVRDEDAEFIVGLRCNPVLNQFLHTTSNSIDDQLRWLHEYYQRANDYYFIIENSSTTEAEGVIGLYSVNNADQDGEWGRWILASGSLASVESAWLIYRFAMDELGLQTVYCRTVADNQKVVSFHDSCGVSNRKSLSKHLFLNGEQVDAIEHRLDREAWAGVQQKLEKLVKMTARKLNHA
ncbi:MAG: GNAT family N-acetyltransferase [Gammaproteobacteria bacterium]|nr:GNAT family N-acetyltransferase [Gammaproteobacteria bacterium]